MRRPAPFALTFSLTLFLGACGDDEPETFPDATQGGFIDGGIRMDAAAPDAANNDDAAVHDDAAVNADAAVTDRGEGFPIRIAYTASAEAPLVEELYLTDTSTSRYKVNPVLACGRAGGEKDPETCGIKGFRWSLDQTQLFYQGQQDTFDQAELYVADAQERRPGVPRKLSNPDSFDNAYLMYQSGISNLVEFTQADAERTRVWTVDSKDPNAVPSFLGMGLINTTHWSPVQDEKVYQEIVVSASDRPLFFAGVYPGAPPPVRVHPNTNLGTTGEPSWAPDGSSFVYVADPRGTRVWEAFRVSVTNSLLGTPERLHPDLGTGRRSLDAYYSPNGTHALYAADPRILRTVELFSVDVSGPVVGEPVVVSSTTADGNGVIDRLTWTASGNNFLFVADREDFGVMELFQGNVAGGPPRKLSPELQNGLVRSEKYAKKESLVVFEISQNQGSGLYATDLSDPSSTPQLISLPTVEGAMVRWDLSPDQTMVMYSVFVGDQFEIYSIDLLPNPVPAPVLLGFSQVFPVWCWDTASRLAVGISSDPVTRAAELYLIRDLRVPTYDKISGPLVQGGHVRSCAFPPR